MKNETHVLFRDENNSLTFFYLSFSLLNTLTPFLSLFSSFPHLSHVAVKVPYSFISEESFFLTTSR